MVRALITRIRLPSARNTENNPRPFNVFPRQKARDSSANRGESGNSRKLCGSSNASSISRMVGASFPSNGKFDQSNSIASHYNVNTTTMLICQGVIYYTLLCNLYYASYDHKYNSTCRIYLFIIPPQCTVNHVKGVDSTQRLILWKNLIAEGPRGRRPFRETFSIPPFPLGRDDGLAVCGLF